MQLKDDAAGYALLIGLSIVIAFVGLLVLARTERSAVLGARIPGRDAATLQVSGANTPVELCRTGAQWILLGGTPTRTQQIRSSRFLGVGRG